MKTGRARARLTQASPCRVIRWPGLSLLQNFPGLLCFTLVVLRGFLNFSKSGYVEDPGLQPRHMAGMAARPLDPREDLEECGEEHLQLMP